MLGVTDTSVSKLRCSSGPLEEPSFLFIIVERLLRWAQLNLRSLRATLAEQRHKEKASVLEKKEFAPYWYSFCISGNRGYISNQVRYVWEVYIQEHIIHSVGKVTLEM